MSRSIVSRSADRVTRSSAPPRAHRREFVTCSVLLEGKDPALGAPQRDKYCGDGSHTGPTAWPRTRSRQTRHTSPTPRSAAEGNARHAPSEHLPIRFAGLPLRLLETCDQHLGEILFSVPTMVTHVGQKQFVHNWTAQASNANQVLLPTSEGLIHLFFRNQQISLGRYYASTTPVRQTPPVRPSESMVQSASLSSFHSSSSSEEVPSTSVDSSDVPVLWLWSVATAKRLTHGKPGNHPSYCAVHGRKEAELPKRCAEPMDRSSSKQHSLPKPSSKQSIRCRTKHRYRILQLIPEVISKNIS